MKLKEKLNTIYEYYLHNRQVGHTLLLKDGTRNFQKDFFVLAHQQSDHDYLDIKSEQVVSWKSDMSKLKGHQKPIAIDNATLTVMLRDILEELDRLEQENTYSSRKLEMIKRIINTK